MHAQVMPHAHSYVYVDIGRWVVSWFLSTWRILRSSHKHPYRMIRVEAFSVKYKGGQCGYLKDETSSEGILVSRV